jgi:LysM repeat protein
VGIEKTVTVKDGQTLSGISRTYLGPGMECYIEAVNSGKRSLAVGDKVNIPKLVLKKKLRK